MEFEIRLELYPEVSQCKAINEFKPLFANKIKVINQVSGLRRYEARKPSLRCSPGGSWRCYLILKSSR